MAESVRLKVDIDTSGAASAEQIVDNLNRKIKELESSEKKDYEMINRLRLMRDDVKVMGSQAYQGLKTNDPHAQQIMQAAASGNFNGLSPADMEKASSERELIKVLKELTAGVEDILTPGRDLNRAEINDLHNKVFKAQSDYNKNLESMNGSPQGGGKAAQDALAKIFSVQMLMGAVTNGVNMYVAHLDRSGIISKMGAGDVIGANIEELRREASKEHAIGEVAGTVGGGLAGFGLAMLIPGLREAVLVATGTGMLMGGKLGGFAGKSKEAEANIKSTEEARVQQWEKYIPGSMQLNAMLNSDAGDAEGNSRNIRATFRSVLESIKGTSHSIEEGMEVMRTVVQQGIVENPGGTVANILKYQDATGADLGVLSRGTARFARFGGGDFLGVGYQGLQASGMQKGQYQEFLQAMEKIFEDGVTKGIVRGSEEIAGTMSFFSQMSGNSPLWQGEQGAQRIMGMNNAMANATGLSSVTDILSYRAASNVIEKTGINNTEDWKKQFGVGNDYVDAMILMEKGLTPELIKEQMKLIKSVEGEGNRAGQIERLRQMFGFNYTTSAKFLKDYELRGNKPWTQAELDAYTKNPGDMESPEKHLLDLTNQVIGLTAAMGQKGLEGKVNEVTAALEKLRLELNPDNNPQKPVEEMTSEEARNEYIKALAAGDFEAASRLYAQIEIAAAKEMHPEWEPGYVDPMYADTVRTGQVSRMLMRTGFSKDGATFFQGDSNPFTKNEDEKAYDRLSAYESAAPEAYKKAIGILEQFPEPVREKVNRDDSINLAIPNVMMDSTGQQLIRALLDLAQKMDVKVTVE